MRQRLLWNAWLATWWFRPTANSVAIAQDRIREKRFISELGISPAPYAVMTSATDLDGTNISALIPGVLKLSRFGYDGKGQSRIATLEEVRAAFDSMGDAPCGLSAASISAWSCRLSLRATAAVVPHCGRWRRTATKTAFSMTSQ